MSRVPLNKQGEIDMFQDMLAMGSGGDGSSFTFDTSPVFTGTSSVTINMGDNGSFWITNGTTNIYAYGYVINGTLTKNELNSSQVTVDYQNGVLTATSHYNTNKYVYCYHEQ